jgi:hypothetical protein
VATVIANLKSSSGDRYYVQGSDGSKSTVIVRRCPHCADRHEVIATTADETRKDNLLELRTVDGNRIWHMRISGKEFG